MTQPPLKKLNVLQSVGAFIDRSAGLLRDALVGIVRGLWLFVGSEQLRNGLLAMGIMLMAFAASRILVMERHLQTIAYNSSAVGDSQRIQGAAYIHQMRAMGALPASGEPDVKKAPLQAVTPEALTDPFTAIPSPGGKVLGGASGTAQP